MRIGTPHRSSAIAGSAEVVRNILSGILRDQQEEKSRWKNLIYEARYFQDINTEFRQHEFQFEIASLYEEKPMPMLGKVGDAVQHNPVLG